MHPTQTQGERERKGLQSGSETNWRTMITYPFVNLSHRYHGNLPHPETPYPHTATDTDLNHF